MADSTNGRDDDGFGAGVRESTGNPVVLLALNAFLSVCFAATIVWGLAFLDVVAYSLTNVATGAIVVFALTYFITSH